MKTAMQELIVHLEMLKSRVNMADINSLIEYATTSLEKEKEQIIDAFVYGEKNIELITEEAKKYYNQTYN